MVALNESATLTFVCTEVALLFSRRLLLHNLDLSGSLFARYPLSGGNIPRSLFSVFCCCCRLPRMMMNSAGRFELHGTSIRIFWSHPIHPLELIKNVSAELPTQIPHQTFLVTYVHPHLVLWWSWSPSKIYMLI